MRSSPSFSLEGKCKTSVRMRHEEKKKKKKKKKKKRKKKKKKRKKKEKDARELGNDKVIEGYRDIPPSIDAWL